MRDLADSQKKQLIELNFEKRPDLASLFSSNNPKEILMNISASIGKKVDSSQSILFLDEIQAAPHLLQKLRWFAEDMPDLPVLAAGSLLDFALAEHTFSMPVGRIGYVYLEPLSFEEFLDACGHRELRAYVQNYQWSLEIPAAIHSQLMKLLKVYLVIGGMPAAVSTWIAQGSPIAVNQIHFDLLATYRDDFAKYSGRLSISCLEDILNSVPRQLGRKFVYRNANSDSSSTSLKQALDLLSTARICHRIIATSANGLPLGAETNEKFIKVILLDCGLCSASLGLSIDQLQSISEISLINSGGIAKQFVGQHLRTILPPFIPPTLYYWQREKRGADAEVDYVMGLDHLVIPIEVKAGTSGKLKSLHQFMKDKNRKLAIRVHSNTPKVCPISVKDFSSSLIEYTLLSIPFYLVGQLPRLLRSYHP